VPDPYSDERCPKAVVAIDRLYVLPHDNSVIEGGVVLGTSESGGQDEPASLDVVSYRAPRKVEL